MIFVRYFVRMKGSSLPSHKKHSLMRLAGGPIIVEGQRMRPRGLPALSLQTKGRPAVSNSLWILRLKNLDLKGSQIPLVYLSFVKKALVNLLVAFSAPLRLLARPLVASTNVSYVMAATIPSSAQNTARKSSSTTSSVLFVMINMSGKRFVRCETDVKSIIV